VPNLRIAAVEISRWRVILRSLKKNQHLPMLEKLERKFHRFAIPNPTSLLIAGQSIVYVMSFFDETLLFQLNLSPGLVMGGEVWRLFTFPLLPAASHPFMFLIFVWMTLFFGRSLETQWGHFRLNVYLLFGYVASLATAFFAGVDMGSTFLISSIFLAFATEFPDFEILLFFILPIKVKFLALLAWAMIFLSILVGEGIATRFAVILPFTHYIVFFGPGLYAQAKTRHRRVAYENRMERIEQAALHKCEVCGLTEHEDDEMMFRVCSKCKDGEEYCESHIRDHKHT
jgi:hypothetical protein